MEAKFSPSFSTERMQDIEVACAYGWMLSVEDMMIDLPLLSNTPKVQDWLVECIYDAKLRRRKCLLFRNDFGVGLLTWI